jgi:hypothetical protein
VGGETGRQYFHPFEYHPSLVSDSNSRIRLGATAKERPSIGQKQTKPSARRSQNEPFFLS